MKWESAARDMARTVANAITLVNPLAGLVARWGVDVAFEVIDDVTMENSPVAVAQHVGDRVADLVEEIKLMGSG